MQWFPQFPCYGTWWHLYRTCNYDVYHFLPLKWCPSTRRHGEPNGNSAQPTAHRIHWVQLLDFRLLRAIGPLLCLCTLPLHLRHLINFEHISRPIFINFHNALLVALFILCLLALLYLLLHYCNPNCSPKVVLILCLLNPSMYPCIVLLALSTSSCSKEKSSRWPPADHRFDASPGASPLSLHRSVFPPLHNM